VGIQNIWNFQGYFFFFPGNRTVLDNFSFQMEIEEIELIVFGSSFLSLGVLLHQRSYQYQASWMLTVS